MRDFKSIVRENILKLAESVPLKENTIDSPIKVHLEANENPFNAPHNRYSNNNCQELKNALSKIKGIWPHCITLSNGTDEAIDFILRVFCNPKKDNVLAIEPTARRYSTYAQLNDVEYKKIVLNENFQITEKEIRDLCNKNTKVIFLCSPNNPTGNQLDREVLFKICDAFQGVVVVDEGYNEFSRQGSLVKAIAQHHNLIVLDSLSKAFASADLRLAVIYAVPEIIRYINAIIPHHHISNWAQDKSIEILQRRYDVDKWINQLLEERRKVIASIQTLSICKKIYPTDANFFLAKFTNAKMVYEFLLKEGIAVYNCSEQLNCENCLRITIGLPNENNALIGALRKLIHPK